MLAGGFQQIFLLAATLPWASGQVPEVYRYTQINGYLCMNVEFTRTFGEISSVRQCSMLCNTQPLCKAFTTADGPCQLFLFDRCSKNVKNCSCSRRGDVFVKQQPGLQPGALCPSGYGDDLCGTKYKVYSTGIQYWLPSRQKCESESGLVIMADVMDATEMTQVEMVCNRTLSHIWLGGYQPAGSPEPAGGWYWVGCNITLDATLWGSGEPNNNGNQNAIAKWLGFPNLTELSETSMNPTGVLCECLSPFN